MKIFITHVIFIFMGLLFIPPVIPHAFAAISPLNFTVSLSENVVVDTTSGTPTISIDVGGVTRTASYVSGSGSAALIFTYTPVAGDVDLDGIALTSPIALNGGIIKDIAGNDIATPVTFPVPTTTGIYINNPSLSLDFINDRHTVGNTVYNSLTSFLSGVGGSFGRTSIGTYFDSAGTLQTATAGTPRYDFDPVTLAAKGILMEESRINLIRNGSAQGAVVGTPGTLPTYWQDVITVGGLSYEVISTGVENGISYSDIRIYGTPSSAYPALYFESSTNIVAASTQAWSISAFIKQVGGSMTGISGIALRIVERTSGGSIVVTNESSVVVPNSGNLSSARLTKNFTLYGGATTAYAHPGIRLIATVGVPLDITLRIGGAQLERGTFATSYIPTTTGAFTRIEDRMVVPIGSWFSGTASTLFASGSTLGINGASTFADINNNGWTERFQIRVQGGFLYSGIITTGNVVQASLSGGATSANAPVKIVMSAKDNDAAIYSNGVLRNSSATVTIPTAQTQLRIGAVSSGSEFLNGHLKSLKYYPLRVANSQLLLMTQ